MAERGHRDRDPRDRDASPTAAKDPTSPSAASVHPLAFLPNLFGRRSTSHKTKAAAPGVTRTSIDEGNPLVSPPAGTVALPPVSGASSGASGGAFHLGTALALLAPGATKSSAELVEIVKATSVHLANALLDHSPADAPAPGLTELGLSAADLRTLYERAMELSDPKQDYSLRTAAIRLLAVLLGAAPPRDSVLDENPYDLPSNVSRRAIYRLITTFSGGTPGHAATNQIYVEVGALKALTREGTIVDGMEGILGWMLRTFTNLMPHWIQWCSSPADAPETEGKDTPFGPIKSASPAIAAAAMIDLMGSIVQNRIALLAPGDLSHIVRPLIEFVWRGIVVAPPAAASTGALRSSPTIGHRPIHPASSMTSNAVPQSTRSRMEVRRTTSLTVGRVEPFPSGGIKPPKSPVRAAASRQVKWSRPFKSLCALVHMLLDNTTINDDLFDEMFELLSFVFGQDEVDAMMDAEMQLGANDLVRAMLSTSSGRRGELALRKALEGKLVLTQTDGRRTPDIERKVTRGAVIIARLAIEDRDFRAQCGLSFSSLCPSLIAAESTSRFPGKAEARAAEWAKWAPVDAEILNLLDAHLTSLEGATSASELAVDDAWTEGEAASEVLDALRTVAEAGAGNIPRTLLTGEGSPFVAHFSSLAHRIPPAIGRLNSLLHSSSSSAESPSLPAPFYHPKYISLLLDLGSHLDEETAGLVIDYYTRECLCLPFTSGWIQNIWQLLEAFGLHYDLPIARVRVSHLLYHDIYGYVQDLPEHRATLVEQVLIPYLSKWLPDETDNDLLCEALDVLVKAAVAETQEKDEDRRRARALKRQTELDAEDASAVPSQEMVESVSGGSFDAIRSLLTKLAMTSPCKEGASHLASHVSVATAGSGVVSPPSAAAAEGLQKEGRGSREGRSREPGGLRSLMRTLSPSGTGAPERTSPPQQNVSSLFAQGDEYFTANPGRPQHLNCKSLQAVKALIAIFTRLAFTTPLAGSQSSLRPVRTPASARCLEVYRDLLHLLYSINDAAGRLPAKCPRGRLVVLQWAMRLRADRKHRILFRGDLNRFVMPFAETLFRTKETEEAIRTQIEAEEARKRARAERSTATQQREDERGRSRGSELSAGARSRSRSKAAAGLLRAPGPERQESYNPLWVLPEHVDFETPPDNHPSEGLLTYDPNHPSLRVKDAPLVEGAWLPVSEYVRVLNGILRWENDWELVSYVLCYLPQQLGNKHFFHGTRAVREIKGLLRVLCDGILETDSRWERRYNIPSFIRRPHINNMAYQGLSILVSYRSVLDRSESERLIGAFVAGLEANALVAKPCIQALTICIYELEGYVAKMLLEILRRVQQILSIPNVAVHILEFLVALGNSPLYRNFTDEQYRSVFAAAMGYIAEHNARSDTSDKDFAANRESFTLSQHVIGLAYHAIYLWFLNIRVSQRTRHVSYLVKGLLHAKSQRGAIDERTEVCFDWLARYTYGNADPKPATSFLSEAVMLKTNNQETAPKSMSWMLGGAIVTVTSHQRSGWATITTTRPTGQTSVIAKLENVPLLELGEDNADLSSLPAFLMANRGLRRDINDIHATVATIEEGEEEGDEEKKDDKDKDKDKAEKEEKDDKADDDTRYDTATAKEDFDPAAVDIVTVKPPPPKAKDEADANFVWSGATPSQRRKDVTVDPSYLALQLLSSYPNNDLRVPRGVLIPPTPKHERALRGIINTSVINTFKIAVLYVGPGQTSETEILGNVDGSPLFLDFLAGLGRIIRLKGQVDVFTGGLDRENDTDGLYAYAWWDDLAQMIFHAPTLMPNLPHFPEYTNKKRLVGNDYVKIIYNESGADFAFDTIKTSFNFVNIVISPYATRDAADAGSLLSSTGQAETFGPRRDEWGGDSEDFFKVVLQVRPGIPDFSPIGEYKLVSRRNLPTLVRQIAHQGNSMAVRFQHVQGVVDAESAEYITDWRARWRSMQRLRNMLPKEEAPKDGQESEELLRDFSRNFTPVAVTES